MDRRSFLKHSAGAVAATSVLLSACKNTNALTASETDEAQEGKMTMRTNPNTGDRVSLLGYGMMRLPVEDGGSGREQQNSPIDQEEVNAQVDYALAHGVNYFDTSPVYCQGRSETATGIALARHPRNSYYIATKMSNFSPQLWPREESIALFERSLEYLQTDYIDYLLLHSVGGGGKNSLNVFNSRFIDNGILNWLVEQKAAGRIRNLGFSYHGDVKIFDMLLKWMDEGKYHWDFVQIELNYLDWEFANEMNPDNTDACYLYRELEKRGIPAVIMEPLLGGRLAQATAGIQTLFRQMDPEASAAKWAFRFAGTPQGVLTVLSGMTYMEHLRENCHTYSPLIPLTTEENEMILRAAHELFELNAIPCTACNYCMPCPYGLNIPVIFAHYNRHLTEDTMPKAANSGSRDYERARKAYLIGYDRKVPHDRQADHCIGCGHCIIHCPQNINIPEEMKKIDKLVERLKQNL